MSFVASLLVLGFAAPAFAADVKLVTLATKSERGADRELAGRGQAAGRTRALRGRLGGLGTRGWRAGRAGERTGRGRNAGVTAPTGGRVARW